MKAGIPTIKLLKVSHSLLHTIKIIPKLSYLSPQEAAEAEENTPQPMLDGQIHTAKRFPTKLHNDDLQEDKKTP